MKIVNITRNARMKKDSDGLFWLMIESSVGPAMFNLSAIETNAHEKKQIGFDDVLEAFKALCRDPN